MAGADAARRRELPGVRAAHRACAHRGAGADQGRRGEGERRTRRAGQGRGPGDPGGGRGGRPGGLGRALPRRRLPDRFGHLVQHEHQRGDRHPRRRAARPGRAPERPRQRLAVVQRRLPLLHPHRGHRRRHPGPGPGAGAPRRRLRTQERGVRRRGEVGAHAPDGRHARDAGPGVRRVRGPGAVRRRAAARLAAAAGRTAAGRHRGGHRHQHPARFPRRRHRGGRPRHRAAADRGPRPLRGAGRPGRHRGDQRAAADHRGRADEDRQRSALDGVRAAHRARRDPAPRSPAGLLDHAGEGQPGGPRGRADGRRPGGRERRHHRHRGCRRELRAERDAPGDRQERPGIDPAARQRLAAAGRPDRRRHHRRPRTRPRVRRVVAVRGDPAEPVHRVRGGRQGGQEGPRGAQDDPSGRPGERVRGAWRADRGAAGRGAGRAADDASVTADEAFRPPTGDRDPRRSAASARHLISVHDGRRDDATSGGGSRGALGAGDPDPVALPGERRRAVPHRPARHRRTRRRRPARGLAGPRHRVREAGPGRRHPGAPRAAGVPLHQAAHRAPRPLAGHRGAEAGPARCALVGVAVLGAGLAVQELVRQSGGTAGPLGGRGGLRGSLPGHRRTSGPQLAVARRGRVRAGPAGRPDVRADRRAGPGGRAGGGRGDRGMGAAVLGRLAGVATGRLLGGTVTPRGLGPHARARVLVRLLMCPRARNVGSSSARALRSDNFRGVRRA
ncbi:hypothetical protein SGPA1_12151 [Streptomyces misionensis JCM 4497]